VKRTLFCGDHRYKLEIAGFMMLLEPYNKKKKNII